MQKFVRMVCLVLVGGLYSAQIAFAQEEILSAQLRITVEPASLLTVNHKVVSEGTAFQLKLPPNQSALLKLSCPGYETAYRVICPMEGERCHESFTLKRVSTPVLFRSNVEAMVLCDGQQLGSTPCTYFFRDPKAYRIVFRAPGFEDRILRLSLENGQPQVVDMDLSSDAATLSVNSMPSGASVLVNGVSRGVTPCTIPRLKGGEHTIQLKLPGYRDYEEVVQLNVAEHVTVNPSLQKLAASLTVTSKPQKATVYVNGVPYGQTPISVDHLAEGVYALRFEHVGYETQVRSVYLKAGQTHTESCELQKQTGVFVVQTQPSKVTISVDGKTFAKTQPKSADSYTSAETPLNLPIGDHTLTFSADGYASATRTVNVKKVGNQPLRIRLEFEPNFEIKTARSVYRGVFVRKDLNGAITLELRPGVFRTFSSKEINKYRFLKEKNAPVRN